MNSKDLFFDVQQGKFINKNKKSDKTTAILYLRVSTEEQFKYWNWIDSQASSCKMHAINNWIEIIEEFKDEWISWRIENRPWLNQALDFLKEKKKKWEQIDYFICSKLSRISRNQDLIKTLNIEKQIENNWTSIITLNKSIKDAKNKGASNILSDGISRMYAKHEAIIWSERTIRWMQNSLLNWWRPFGSVPVGFKKEESRQWRKIITKDYPNCDIMKEWLEMFSNWELENQTSLYLFFLEKWLTSNHNKKEKKLHYSIIARILTVEKLLLYAWYIVYPKRWIKEPIKWKHEKIINLETANNIIRKINKCKIDIDPPTSKTRKDFDKSFLLRWLLYCPDCWKKYTWWYCRWRHWKKYPYYRCNNKDCRSKSKSYINSFNIHEQFKNYLKTFSVDKDILDNIEEVFNQCWKRQKKEQKNIDLDSKSKVHSKKK